MCPLVRSKFDYVKNTWIARRVSVHLRFIKDELVTCIDFTVDAVVQDLVVQETAYEDSIYVIKLKHVKCKSSVYRGVSLL